MLSLSPALSPAKLPNLPLVSIKAAPLRGTASGAPRAGLCLGRPARRARAVLSLSVPPIFHAYSSRHAVQQRPRLAG
jgi:hypothetical protein